MNPKRLPRIPVSWGELIDKITILEIKAERLRSAQACGNARRELALLARALARLTDPPVGLEALGVGTRCGEPATLGHRGCDQAKGGNADLRR